jgi:hypothetical protein
MTHTVIGRSRRSSPTHVLRGRAAGVADDSGHSPWCCASMAVRHVSARIDHERLLYSAVTAMAGSEQLVGALRVTPPSGSTHGESQVGGRRPP